MKTKRLNLSKTTKTEKLPFNEWCKYIRRESDKARLGVTTICLLLGLFSFGQCNYDTCEQAYNLTINEHGTFCAPEVQAGNVNVIAGGTIVLITHYCEDENQGDVSCWVQDHDYWIQVNIANEGVYHFSLTSDYTNFQLEGGAHFAVYEGGCNGLYQVFNPYCPNNPQTESLTSGVYLYAGEYWVQVDGFGLSTGASQLCIISEPLLSLGVDVPEWNVHKEPYKVWVIRKHYLRK